MKLATTLAALAAIALSTPVEAKQVFQTTNGRWNIDGYVDVQEDQRYCILSTYWEDGRKMQINVFPTTEYITMTFYDPYFEASINDSKTMVKMYYSSGSVRGYVGNWPDEKNRHTTIYRNITEDFLQAFADAKSMVFFEGQPNEVEVLLDGTQDIMNEILPDCLHSL